MIGVAICDDHPVVREGIRRVLAESADFRVLGEATGSDEAYALCERVRPDVLVLDISTAGAKLLETLRLLHEKLPQIRILVFSVHSEAQHAVRCLEAGAAGYLTKDGSSEALVDAIRSVAGGRRYLSETVAQKLAARALGDLESLVEDRLSPREYQIFLLLGAGKSVSQIGAELELSPKTVSTHRARILEKTQLQSNANIIRFVIEHGLLD